MTTKYIGNEYRRSPDTPMARRNLEARISGFVIDTNRDLLRGILNPEEIREIRGVLIDLLPDDNLQRFLELHHIPIDQLDNRTLYDICFYLNEVRKRIDQRFNFGNLPSSDLPYALTHILTESKRKELYEHEEDHVFELLRNKYGFHGVNLLTVSVHFDQERQRHLLEMAIEHITKYFEMAGINPSDEDNNLDPDMFREESTELSVYVDLVKAELILSKIKYQDQDYDSNLVNDLVFQARNLVRALGKRTNENIPLHVFDHLLRETQVFLEEIGEYTPARKIRKISRKLNEKLGFKAKKTQKLKAFRKAEKSKKFSRSRDSRT